jgi:hypothetical protein
MKRNLIRIAGWVGLGLASWMTASASPRMTPLAQSRSASVDAFALWTSGGESDARNFSDAAVDLQQFTADPRAEVATSYSAADVQASHSSVILPLQISAQGSMAVDAFSALSSQGSTAGGAANSRFELQFEVSEPTKYRIAGSLAATGALAAVELLGSGGTLFHRTLTDGEELMQMQGALEPGIYTFSARIVGTCTAQEIESCRSAGYFDASLFLGDAATMSQSSSFAALKAQYD